MTALQSFLFVFLITLKYTKCKRNQIFLKWKFYLYTFVASFQCVVQDCI